MNFKKLFARSVPETLTVDELTDALTAARLRLASRDQRITELTAELEIQQNACAAETARQTERIAALQAQLRGRTRSNAGESEQLHAMQQDLAAAFELLDEFEADAHRGQAALARVEVLEDELAACRILIADEQATGTPQRFALTSVA